jgi:hypothetical protein
MDFVKGVDKNRKEPPSRNSRAFLSVIGEVDPHFLTAYGIDVVRQELETCVESHSKTSLRRGDGVHL